MIKVLVVEDSPLVREFMVYILGSDPEIEVVGTANNGEEAIEAVKIITPHVITMDINMPKMDGLEATRRIMETYPTPIVIVSGSWDTREVATTFRAMEAGALAILPRPKGIGHAEYESSARELVQTVRLMSEVKVIRRWPRPKDNVGAFRETPLPERPQSEIRIVAIGTSTGGPIVLQTILSRLPKDLPVPLLIVQHMASEFTMGLVDWLAQSSGFPVHVASHGEYHLPGHAYMAPEGFHMGVGGSNQIALSKNEPENGLRPSVSYLFRSVSKVFGPNAVGVLLTGMGKDGAEELSLMKEKGAITIVQDEESSVVYGMPGEALRLDAATYVLPPEGIAATLESLVKNMKKERG